MFGLEALHVHRVFGCTLAPCFFCFEIDVGCSAMWQACPYRVAAAVHALSTEMLASEFCVLFDFQTALALGCQGLKGHMSNS
jgi:hypothetical protein